LVLANLWVFIEWGGMRWISGVRKIMADLEVSVGFMDIGLATI
jgi:hypothetical protein